MKKFRFVIYDFFRAPNIIDFISKHKISINWVVEAGCHDGSDTIKFLKVPSVRRIYAFEPDEIARMRAESNCAAPILNGEIVIYPFALANENRDFILLGNAGQYGTGSTQVIEIKEENLAGAKSIQGRRLDETLMPESGEGLLWLDVEGSALTALEGSRAVLNRFTLIQVEVEFQDMWGGRMRNFESVIRFLESFNFCLIKAPIYPGLFGDLLWRSNPERKHLLRIRSWILKKILILLHTYLYPFTHKKKFNSLS
jgi:FkbM family methyltransferase